VAEASASRASAETEQRVREAFPVALTADDRSLMADGYRRLTTNQTTRAHPLRDLQPLAQDWMCRVTHWLWESNPLARWLVETTVDFVLGEGVVVESDVPAVQAVITGFWDDPVNQLDRRMDGFTREYGLYGELVLQVFVNPVDGHVRLGYIDPLEIDSVFPDPQNALIQTSVLLKGRAGAKGPILKVVREETNRARATYGLLMPNEPGERDLWTGRVYDGACHLFQTNKLSNGRRGRSDLLASIDWLDGYDAFLFDSMDNANLFNSFVYDAKLEGFTEAQITDWLTKFGASIKKGGVFAHNEKVELKEVTPDLKALDKDAFARLYRGHILGGHSYPEHWYGLAGEVNFASAKEMGLPPVKRLTRRQKEVRFIVEDLVRFALHQAIRARLLPPEVVVPHLQADGSSRGTTRPAAECVTIRLPELSMRDQAATVAAVTSLVAALTQAKAEGWVRQETAAKLFAHLASQLGLDVNPDDEVTAGVPGGAAMGAYGDPQVQRLLAQLTRQGEGNGDNVNEPKRTTPVGGQVPA
jgi:hypothetical protein